MENLSIDNDETLDNTSQSSKNKKKKKAAQRKSAAVPTTSTVTTRSRFAALKAAQIKKQRVGVVYDDFMLLHRSHNAEHPERPERVMSIYLNLVKKDILKSLIEIHSEVAVESDLVLAHNAKHV